MSLSHDNHVTSCKQHMAVYGDVRWCVDTTQTTHLKQSDALSQHWSQAASGVEPRAILHNNDGLALLEPHIHSSGWARQECTSEWRWGKTKVHQRVAVGQDKSAPACGSGARQKCTSVWQWGKTKVLQRVAVEQDTRKDDSSSKMTL